jgi:hypothetical protein
MVQIGTEVLVLLGLGVQVVLNDGFLEVILRAKAVDLTKRRILIVFLISET